MNSPWRTLRVKIIAWSFIPTTIILLAVTLVTFDAYRRVAEDQVISRNRELTRLSAGQLAADIEEYSDLLATIARTVDIHSGDPSTQRDALNRARNRLVVFDAGVVILNNHGMLVAAEPHRPEDQGEYWADRSYFRQLLRSSEPIFSEVVPDGLNGSEVIVVAVPITGNLGEFKGAMVGMFQLGAPSVSSLYGGIVKLRIGESGRTYLVDSNRRIIYHQDIGRIGEELPPQGIAEQLMAMKVGEYRYQDSEGTDIVASFSPVRGTPWVLVSEESWATMMSSSEGHRQFLLFLLALGVVFPALVVTLGVTKITGPIAKLIDGAKDVAGGRFGQTISVTTGDELEELAKQFNIMSAQLQESYADLERKVEYRTRELATLNSIAEAVSRSLDLDEILHDALEKTLQTMGMETAGIYLLDEKGDTLNLATHRGIDPEFVPWISRLKVGEGFSDRVVQMGQPVVVEDVSTDPWLTRVVPIKWNQRTLASAPLTSPGKVVGAIFISNRGLRQFTPQDLQLLSSIGHYIGVAVANARLFDAEQRRAEQFRMISEVGQRITSILAVDELLNEIARLVRDTQDCYLVCIGLVEGDELVIKAGAGACWERDGFQAPKLRIGAEGITGWVARSGEPLLVPDVNRDTRYKLMAGAEDTRAEIAVPLKTKDEVIGVLDVQSDQANAFDESDLVVLQSLAYQAAVAIENARLYEQAQQLAVMKERNRLARDLHDSVTQAVYSVTLYAEASARLLSVGQVDVAADHLRELRATAQQALREMRSLIFELRPPVLEKEGLVAALHARLDAVEGRSGVKTEFLVEGDASLPAELERELYHIAQEALNNALKHAQAGSIKLHLRCDEQTVMMEIVDDGA
ncbi:MAG: GAF domain-containing protein, partial [Chloroflexota bacterium]